MKQASKAKNIFLHTETWMIVAFVVAITIAATVLFLLLFNYIKYLFAWIMLGFAVFITRSKDIYKLGIEFYNLAAFLSAFAMGFLFSFSMLMVSLYASIKVRPDQLEGIIVNMGILSIMAGISAYFAKTYGLGIGEPTFVWIALIVIMIGILADLIFAAKFTPAPIPRLIFSHFLEFIFNYTLITSVGYTIFKFLISI